MRPDRSTPRVVALFQQRWPGGLLPEKLILKEVRKDGAPMSERAVEYALAKAVSRGHLRIVKSADGGALYGLASYVEANAALVNSVQRAPLRTLQRQNVDFDSKAVRRWIRSDGLNGAHDLRPRHKCIPCGNVPHRDQAPKYALTS